MKVLLTAVSSSSKISGVQRHTFNVARCLLLHPEVSAVYLVIAPWQRELCEAAGLPLSSRLIIRAAEVGRGPVSRNAWYYRQLPYLTGEIRPDLIHLSYPVPLNSLALGCPTVLSLHDLYPYEIPSNFHFPHVLFNRLVLRQCLRSVSAIACVSDATLLQMKQFTSNRALRKAIRIYNCVEPEPFCSEHSPLPDWSGEPFLLCVAQHRRNKNIPLLIQVFRRLLDKENIDPAMKLVVVGIDGPETARIKRLVARFNLSHKVLFLDGLSEPELQWCYAHCEVLAVPSTTEGFGLPAAEGLLAGCRVICSDIPALREIGGQHCRFISLGKHEKDDLADEIIASLREPRRKPVALPHLSSRVLANEYVSLYRRLLSLNVSRSNPGCAAPARGITPERQSL